MVFNRRVVPVFMLRLPKFSGSRILFSQPVYLGNAGTDITISGTALKEGDTDPEVRVGETLCPVKSSTATSVFCTLPAIETANYAIKVYTYIIILYILYYIVPTQVDKNA